MSEELLNPPYPGDACTAENLYSYLGDLRVWILHYRDSLNTAVGTEVIPEPNHLGKKPAYLAQPVPQLFSHYMFLRKLREEWDHVVRMYENDWDDKHCLRARAVLLQAAAVNLNEAFVPQELREARAQKHMERLHRAFESLRVLFDKITEPGHEKEEGGTD